MLNAVDAILDEYQDHLEEMTVQELYVEQDRIMSVVARLNTMHPPPMKMLHLLEVKLEMLEYVIDNRFPKGQKF